MYGGTYNKYVDKEVQMDVILLWFWGIRLNFAKNIVSVIRSSTGDHSPTNNQGNKVAITKV